MRNDLTLKRALIVATYTVVLYCLLNNLPGVADFTHDGKNASGSVIVYNQAVLPRGVAFLERLARLP